MSKTSRAGKAVLSHVDARGRVKMVDVGDKPITAREAIARGSIAMSAEARRQIRAGAVKKPAGRQLVPGGCGGGFCAPATRAAMATTTSV